MAPKFIMYWEQADKSVPVPAHVRACIEIMTRRYGSDFKLFDEITIRDALDCNLDDKIWGFGVGGNDELERKKLAIVAKSDFIRLRYIYLHGGVWVDSDGLNVGDANRIYELSVAAHPFIWGYEAFFAARPGQKILKNASDNMLELPSQLWGNPGGLKDLIQADPSSAYRMPYHWLEPKPEHNYGWQSTDILMRTDIDPCDFLSEDQIFLHLFNKSFWLRTTEGIDRAARMEAAVEIGDTLIGRIIADQGLSLALPHHNQAIELLETTMQSKPLTEIEHEYDRFAAHINYFVAGYLSARDAHIGIIGNIYYSHDICSHQLYNLVPEPYWQHKRERVSAIARRYQAPQMLEVGINAGHSAAIALISNAELIYTGVDNASAYYDGTYTIRSDLYVPACMGLLQSVFDNRTSWHRGNSVDTLRAIAADPASKGRYNILHLDAAKHLYYDDFKAALPMLADDCTVIIDDTSTEEDTANITLRQLISEGHLILDSEFPDVRGNAICRLTPRG